MHRLATLAVAVALVASEPVQAQSLEEVRRALDQAQRTIQELQQQVRALEAQAAGKPASPAAEPTAATGTTAATATATAPVPAPVVGPDSTAEAGAKAPDGARIEFNGHVMLDAIHDFKRVDPEWNATLRPSKIPVVCPGDPGCGPNGETILSIRQTRLGFKAYVPTSLGEMTALLDFDLFEQGGGVTRFRVLNAWGTLGRFGAGQTYSLFMNIDTFPNTLDYWGPSGMVFIRNPQLRFTPFERDGMKLSFSLEQPGSAVDTGKIAAVDPALASGVTGRSRLPDLIGSLRTDREWGHFQASGVLRQIGYETPANPNGQPTGSRNGYGLNLSGQYNTFGQDRIVAQLVYGRGIASYMNDGGVDLAPDAALRAQAVDSLGWFAYYDHYWTPKWSSSAGYSEHRQSNAEGQLSTAFRKGSYSSVNLLHYPAKNVTVGAELLWGRRENRDGASNDDQRIQFSAKYKF